MSWPIGSVAFMERLREIVAQVISGAEQVTEGSRIVAESSQLVAQGLQTQSASLQQISAAVDQLASSVEAVQALAAETDRLARQSRESALHGSQAVEKSLAAMQAIRDASKRIADIIQVISEIAGQTNLLALNAAIEAARAWRARHGVRRGGRRSPETGRAVQSCSPRDRSTHPPVFRVGRSPVPNSAIKWAMLSRKFWRRSMPQPTRVAQITQTTREQTTAAQEVRTAVHGIAQVTEQSRGWQRRDGL